MRVTTGIDIVEVNRVRKLLDEHGETFIKKLFTEKEIEYCEKSKVNRDERYAVRFSAKEAVYKVLDMDSSEDMEWRDIEIDKLETGRPIVLLHNELENKLQDIVNIDISLSHIEETATASVVVLWK